MIAPEAKFRNYLRRKGLKFTPERQVILRQALSFQGHFNADNLYRELSRTSRKLSRATVYRTLPLLVQSDIISETPGYQGRAGYEHIFGHSRHDHLVCVRCGRIIEFLDEGLEDIQNKVCKKYGFASIGHKLGIKGYCRRCRSQGES